MENAKQWLGISVVNYLNRYLLLSIMDIEIDYNPSPIDRFFISVAISETEALSFDYTQKGHRIIKQVLKKIDETPSKEETKDKPDAEWDSIVLHDGSFVRKYHVVWYDRDSEDLVNDELWETVWERPIDDKTRDRLSYFSQLVSDHFEELDKYRDEIREFERFLAEQIGYYQKEL